MTLQHRCVGLKSFGKFPKALQREAVAALEEPGLQQQFGPSSPQEICARSHVAAIKASWWPTAPVLGDSQTWFTRPQGWEKKKAWYAANGFIEGKNLFTSTEGPGLDMTVVESVAAQIKKALDR
ncbi:hypothetical protein [Roseateles sp. LYH14W]|uniref:Uncharacterized protein n=1 Tax=Pelomonas parva TaxID=3299032 RepID=A0ABW7F885_9BURK